MEIILPTCMNGYDRAKSCRSTSGLLYVDIVFGIWPLYTRLPRGPFVKANFFLMSWKSPLTHPIILKIWSGACPLLYFFERRHCGMSSNPWNFFGAKNGDESVPQRRIVLREKRLSRGCRWNGTQWMDIWGNRVVTQYSRTVWVQLRKRAKFRTAFPGPRPYIWRTIQAFSFSKLPN